MFGAAVLIASWRMDRLGSLQINPWSAPGLMPGVLGALMLVFGVALALRRGGEVDALEGSARRTALALVLCVGFAAGLLGRGLPFWPGASLFLFLSIFAFRILDPEPGAARWRVALSSAVIAICAALVISFIFEDLFLVRLP